MQVFFISLYGVLDMKFRTSVEMRGYKQYLKAVCEHIATTLIPVDDRNEQAIILFDGGKTNPLTTESEAASVRQFIKFALGETLESARLMMAEYAINAPQQIHYLKQQILRQDWYLNTRVNDTLEVTIFCDSVRIFKTWALARRMLGPSRQPNLHWQVKGFDRADIHPNSNKWVQAKAGCAYLFSKKMLSQALQATR